MSNLLKLKDVILIALLTALYIVLYLPVMMAVSFLGPFGHTISPGIVALIAGSIFYFMAAKVGKLGQFTLMALLVQGVFSIMTGLYLPWFITSIVGALLADLLASRQNNPSVISLAIASAIIHVGSALGAIVPAIFFADSYRETWVSRGQTLETMNEMIHYETGVWALAGIVIIAVLAFAGILLAHIILRKHLRSVR